MRPRRLLESATVLIFAFHCSCSNDPSTPPAPDLETVTVVMSDYEYVRGQYFFLRDPDGCPWRLNTLDLFVDNSLAQDDDQLQAIDAIATPHGGPADPGDTDAHEGRFHRLDWDDDYRVQITYYDGHAIVQLDRPLLDNEYLAATFRGTELDWKLSPAEDFQVGGFDQRVYLKLLRPSVHDDRIDPLDLSSGPWGSLHRLEVKNIYDLGHTRIQGLNASVQYHRAQGVADRLEDGTTFLQLLGVDLTDTSEGRPVAGSDGVIDSGAIHFGEGKIHFPDLRPFDPWLSDLCLGTVSCGGGTFCRYDPNSSSLAEERPRINGEPAWTQLDASFRVPWIYDIHPSVMPDPEEYSRYRIVVEIVK